MSADRVRPHGAVRTAVLLDVLTEALAELAARLDTIQVLDVGGGTGGVAVPLAEIGYPVTVVDPSPDSLAALERRVAETATSALVTGRQGDATELVNLFGHDSVDVVICHSVLEVVDDPADALAAVAAVLRPGGLASVLVANRVAAVVARVASGRLAEARHLLCDPAGSAGPSDPMTRRFTLDEVTALVTDAGLQPQAVHGIRVFSDAAPAALLDIDPHAAADLLALERDAAQDPAYTTVATQLHLLAERK